MNNPNNKKYDYEGCHATADLVLTSYPKDLVNIIKESIKYSKLNIVKESIHDFGEAVTALWTLSESHFSLHEYPENNYITVDCYTCGLEGDPLAAINHLISELDAIVGIHKKQVKFFKRGDFDTSTISIIKKAFSQTPNKEINAIQEKMDKITLSLSSEQIKLLEEVIEWCEQEKLMGKRFPPL
jgi:S-adenosylmethionine decarboxylase